MPKRRFSRLEMDPALPPQVRQAIEHLNRFQNLEIGTAASAPPRTAPERLLCRHCGQANETERSVCWACFKPLKAAETPAPAAGGRPEPDQPIQLILNGVTYNSEDPHLLPPVRVLMDRIRAEGYSPELLARWQREFPDAQRSGPPPAAAATDRVQLFQGQRGSVLRLDGKLYQSTDADLPPEIREIFAFVEQEGVTPALLQHLRLYGTTVKYRPLSTGAPSDGDLDFWSAVKRSLKGPPR